MPAALDLAGQRYGRLTVLRFAGRKPRGERLWLCRCDCGTERVASVVCLRNGHTSSCGCLILESRTRHGGYKSPEYKSWQAMKRRCYTPSSHCFDQYGGRGIVVCDEWRDSFAEFLRDMGRKPSPVHTLDRIDPCGSYCKSNCVWSTPKGQGQHRRTTLTVTIGDERKTLDGWSAVSTVPAVVIYGRLRRGKSGRDAVFSPYRSRKSPRVDPLSRQAMRSIWNTMKRRCCNPDNEDYPAYGGRGIKVCQRWLDSFEHFLVDVGPRPSPGHSLDRIDGGGDYTPANVRWATRYTQSGNRDTARLLTWIGKTQCLAAWARIVGLRACSLARRIDVLGWSVEEALTIPKGGKRPKRTPTATETDRPG